MNIDIDRFRSWLKKQKNKRIDIRNLLDGFAKTYPECPSHNWRSGLLYVLEAMHKEGDLKFPSDKNKWDKIGNPHLPMFVTLSEIKKAKSNDFTKIHWVPELMKFVKVNKNRDILPDLVRINEFIKNNTGKQNMIVPYRERALQIFGDEKYFDDAVTDNKLYNILDLSVIWACNPEPPLLKRDYNVAGKPLLIVENHHTWWSVAQWNENALRYTSIVYGGGNYIMRIVSPVVSALNETQASHIEYFGDLDPSGINIPAQLNKKANKYYNVSIAPAEDIYELLVENGVRRKLAGEKKLQTPNDLATDWLPEKLRKRVLDIFSKGEWLPQEGVGLEVLSRLT